MVLFIYRLSYRLSYRLYTRLLCWIIYNRLKIKSFKTDENQGRRYSTANHTRDVFFLDNAFEKKQQTESSDHVHTFRHLPLFQHFPELPPSSSSFPSSPCSKPFFNLRSSSSLFLCCRQLFLSFYSLVVSCILSCSFGSLTCVPLCSLPIVPP